MHLRSYKFILVHLNSSLFILVHERSMIYVGWMDGIVIRGPRSSKGTFGAYKYCIVGYIIFSSEGTTRLLKRIMMDEMADSINLE